MSAGSGTIDVVVNGETASVEAGLTLLGLLERLGRDPRTVAVEHNGKIVARPAYGDRELEAGDRLEVVHFVQGGAPGL